MPSECILLKGGGGADLDVITASASDVAKGKTFFGAGSDEPQTGTVTEVTTSTGFKGSPALYGNASLEIPVAFEEDTLMRKDSILHAYANRSNFGDAVATNVLAGKTFTSSAGLKVTGTMAIQSAISFSAAAQSSTTIRISWKNPSKGPWTGVKIRMSTSSYPGVSGGTLKYTGRGSSTTPGGTSYVDISGLEVGTTYYFTCYSYVTGLGDSTTGTNVTATTGGFIAWEPGNNALDFEPRTTGSYAWSETSTCIEFTESYPRIYATKNVDYSKYSKVCFDIMPTWYYSNYNKTKFAISTSIDGSSAHKYANHTVSLNSRVTLSVNISSWTHTGILNIQLQSSTTSDTSKSQKISGKIYRIWLE